MSFSVSLEPRSLTPEQIDSIIQKIPDPRGAGKTARSIARKHLVDRLRAILETVKLVPSEEAFKEFQNEIIRSFYESQEETGKPVGVSAGVALGGPITQLSLNSFHFAGADSGVALAFQKIRDFLTGSKMNRTPEMKIFFRQVTRDYPSTNLHDTLHKGTFESIIARRKDFEQTTVQDLILDRGIRVLTKDEAYNFGVPEMVELHSRLRPTRFSTKEKFPLNTVVELQLNTYRMYTHRITMGMVAKAIEGSDPPDILTVVWRSQIDGRIYILFDETYDFAGYLDKKSTLVVKESKAILLYIHRMLIPNFKLFKVSGITNIFSLEPRELEVMKGIYQIRRSKSKPEYYKVYTTNYRTRWLGISLADIHNLFRIAGFQVEPLTPKVSLSFKIKYNKDNPEENPVFKGTLERAQGLKNLTDLQKKILQTRKAELMEALTFIVETARAVDLPERNSIEKKIVEASSFYYAVSNGSNMQELAWRYDVDHFRTASNHPHDIFEFFGIDAAMVFMTHRFRQILEDFRSVINPRHISLIFALLCNLGIINSLSFSGINRRKVGPLAMSSYERAFEVFSNSAIFGEVEHPVGVSPAIFLGQKSKRIGTGSIEIEQNLTKFAEEPPPLPTADEVTGFEDFIFSDDLIEGTRRAELAESEETKISETLHKLDQPKFLESLVASVTSSLEPIEESILPGTAKLVTAPETLLRALNKITLGTPGAPLTVEPENPKIVPKKPAQPRQALIPDILTLTDITGLKLKGPSEELARPASTSLEAKELVSSLHLAPIEAKKVKPEPVKPEFPAQPPGQILAQAFPVKMEIPGSQEEVKPISVKDFLTALGKLRK